MTAPQLWPTTRLCPATSNLPTRMLASTWQALCAAMQRREAVGARNGGVAPEEFKAISAARFPCAVCGGRTLPPGLELITQQEAEQMARTTKRGTCDLCGANSNVGTNHGSKACTNCTHIQSALSKRPQSVANAIRAMGKTEEILSALIPSGGLAVKVTADLLQEISGIVGYWGEDPSELVAAVRKRALTCASCDTEDVLAEIREIVGYTPDQGDKGLADAVRWLQAKASSAMDCANCTTLRDDLLRACGLEMDDTEDGEGWDVAAAAAIQTIAEIEYFYRREAARFLVALEDEQRKQAVIRNDTAHLYEEKINRANAAFLHTVGELKDEIARLSGQTHSESEQVTALRADLSRSSEVIEQLRAELILAQQSRDEREQRAIQAESNVETLESELRNREDAPSTPCASTTYLLDIALRALRGEGPDADQLATLLDAARRAA